MKEGQHPARLGQRYRQAPRARSASLVTRELQRADFATTVRGAPTGEYVTATFLCQFADAPPVLETVLLTFEDGQAGASPATTCGKACADPGGQDAPALSQGSERGRRDLEPAPAA